MADDACVLFALWGRMGNANYSIIWTIWSLLFQYSILAQRIRSDNAGTKHNTKYLSVISGFDKFASSIHGSRSSQQRSVFNAFAVFQCPNNFFLRRPIVGRPTADHRPTADCRKQKWDIIWDLGLAELPIIIGSLDSLNFSKRSPVSVVRIFKNNLFWM